MYPRFRYYKQVSSLFFDISTIEIKEVVGQNYDISSRKCWREQSHKHVQCIQLVASYQIY